MTRREKVCIRNIIDIVYYLIEYYTRITGIRNYNAHNYCIWCDYHMRYDVFRVAWK